MTEIRPINRCEESLAAIIESECLTTAWSESQIADRGEHTLYLVALYDGEICGIASANFVLDDGEILNIAVSKAYRGRGIASALMEKILNEAKSRNVSTVTLEVAADNKSAISLYGKFGFEKVGRRKGFYGDVDGIVYQLTY